MNHIYVDDKEIFFVAIKIYKIPSSTEKVLFKVFSCLYYRALK